MLRAEDAIDRDTEDLRGGVDDLGGNLRRHAELLRGGCLYCLQNQRLLPESEDATLMGSDWL